MTVYSVQLTDRPARRIVRASDATTAAVRAVGNRLVSLRMVSSADAGQECADFVAVVAGASSTVGVRVLPADDPRVS